MHKHLVIVESPTKSRTIARFLGKDYIVESSFGHVRDLPKSELGVDVEGDFTPKYVIPRKARPNVTILKRAAKNADTVVLATDEDREGEAIAWHLTQALDLGNAKPKKTKSKRAPDATPKIPNIQRIVFHEITKRAIEEALEHPRDIDVHLVDAQQARRVLDRLVGYKLSPFLWKKVHGGLSAGRVQSVAVRLVVQREREIQQFKPQEYWSIVASLLKVEKQGEKIGSDNTFDAHLTKINGETLDKFAIKTKEEADAILQALDNAGWSVQNVEQKAVMKHPFPPHTTSTLQQDAFRRLGFSAKQTMYLAQQLYETGLITYMRTDSVHLSNEAITAATAYIRASFGTAYALPEPRQFKTKTKGAQEAHEAIRPTDPNRTPENIGGGIEARQQKLYGLIWKRFLATQMPAAIFDSTAVDITANPKPQTANTTYNFRATGQVMRFDGFLKVYPIKYTEATLPDLAPGEPLDLLKLSPEQHFTQPPARFTEASLVKILEENGIGRPSTYAPTISTVQDRGYIERVDRRYLKPTETGCIVNDLLVEHFPEIVDIAFTANMEQKLDEIAEGETPWKPVVRTFYEPFARHLAEKYEEVQKQFVEEKTDEICVRCGKPMTVKRGRFGKFLACTGFPDCKNTKSLNQKSEPERTGIACPKCTTGELVARFTKKRRKFYGCSRYPECDHATWDDPRPKKDENVNTDG